MRRILSQSPLRTMDTPQHLHDTLVAMNANFQAIRPGMRPIYLDDRGETTQDLRALVDSLGKQSEQAFRTIAAPPALRFFPLTSYRAHLYELPKLSLQVLCREADANFAKAWKHYKLDAA